MSGVFGGGFGSQDSPGSLSGFDLGQVRQGMGQSINAMQNRYSQLGLGGPGTTGGAGPMGTAEAMDLGQAPSLTGGIPAQFQALLGQLQNQSLSNAPSGPGGGSSPASAIGGGLSLLGAFK